MGCWNGTCAISNLHILCGQSVAVFMLAENKNKRTFCYTNALYDVCPIPFYGNYNDYGSVDDCKGFGLPLVLDAIKRQLYEFGQGPNSYHDCEVNKENFDLDKMFDADHEDRLGIQQAYSYDNDSYDIRELEKKRDEAGLTASQQFELDRLAAKIKKVDTFRQVTHVTIHMDVFNDILNKWYIQTYVGDGTGDTGYGNNYRNFYFKDLIDSIPEYIERIKKHIAELEAESEIARRYLRRDIFEWNDTCVAGTWMNGFNSGESNTFGIINVKDYVDDYIDAKDWDGLAAFAKEALTGAWINSFMAHTRKAWSQQCGMGSQNSERVGYGILANSVLDILKAEKAEYEEDDEDDGLTDEEVAAIEET